MGASKHTDRSIVANSGQTTYDANGNITATNPYPVTVDWVGDMIATQSSATGLSADLLRARAMNSIASGGVSQSIPASVPASPASDVHAAQVTPRATDVNNGGDSQISALTSPGLNFASTYAAALGGSPANNGVSFPRTNEKVRALIGRVAAGYQGSTRWLDTVVNGKVQYGCNVFVGNVLDQAAAMAPVTSTYSTWLKYLAQQTDTPYVYAFAGEWADPKKQFTCWNHVPGGADAAQAGDVIAQQFDFSDATGHAGIVVQPGQTASADSQEIPPGIIFINDFGFRATTTQNKFGEKQRSAVSRYSCW